MTSWQRTREECCHRSIADALTGGHMACRHVPEGMKMDSQTDESTQKLRSDWRVFVK